MDYLKFFHYTLMKYDATVNMLYFHSQEKKCTLNIILANT